MASRVKGLGTGPPPEAPSSRPGGSGPAHRLPRPTVREPGRSSPGASRPGPPRSPFRIVAYVAVFACLVGLSLLLKASAGSGGSPAPSNRLSPGPPGASGQSAGPAQPGPSPIVDSPWAGQACSQGNVLPRGFRLAAAFQTTAETAASWEDGLAQGSVHSPLHDFAPGATVAVCYIDGPWQPPPEVKNVYDKQGVVADRGIVLVVQNQAAPIQGPIAPHESLPAQRPTSTPRP